MDSQPVTTIGNCLICGKGSYLADGLCMTCWDRQVDLEDSGKIRDWRNQQKATIRG